MDPVAFIVALVFLLVASYTDLRTREVPDLASYGLIIIGVAYGVAKALLLASWTPLLQMLLGGGVGVALGFAMFYLGQWGGADAKLIMGLGALLGLGFGTADFFLFLVLMLFAGAAYGLLYAAFLAVRGRKAFAARFKALIREREVHFLRIAVVACGFLLLLLAVFLETYRPMLLGIAVALYLLFYAWVCVRVVETALLIKEYPVGTLTEGDWIHKDVVVRGKRICGPKDLGISDEQIATLKRLKVRNVWVKEGIPFVPSFLLALLALFAFGPSLAQLLSLLV